MPESRLEFKQESPSAITNGQSNTAFAECESIDAAVCGYDLRLLDDLSLPH